MLVSSLNHTIMFDCLTLLILLWKTSVWTVVCDSTPNLWNFLNAEANLLLPYALVLELFSICSKYMQYLNLMHFAFSPHVVFM